MPLNDYTVLMSQPLMFDICDSRKCIGINNTVVKTTETFTVSLDSLHERISADPEVAVIKGYSVQL